MNGRSGDYILFVSNIFLYHGGVSDYTDNFAIQLHKHGKLNAVVTPFVEKEQRDYPIKKFRIRLYRKSFLLDRRCITSKIATFFYYIRLYYISFIRLKKLVKNKQKTTIIFTEYYVRQFDIIILCARLLKIQYGIVFHGLDLIKAKANDKDNLFLHFKNNFSKANFIIFNSIATTQLCKKLFPTLTNHSMIMYPGINVPLLEQKRINYKNNQYRTDKETIIFSTVSRLVPRKGIDIAIQIVSHLSKIHPNIKYYIGGVGSEKEKLKTLVSQFKAEAYISFLGDITNEVKYQLLQESDIFILPNHSAGNSDFEGFGISFIEASLFGNVIIGGNHGGAVEAIIEGKTGFLFDFDKPDSLQKSVDLLKNCIENRELLHTIKQNGIDFVKSNYDWNILINRFLEFVN